MKRNYKKKPLIKPNLPSREEINCLLTENRLARAFKANDQRRHNPGRPKKWDAGEQVRLQTRVRPETHQKLLSLSREKSVSIGEILDELL
jgi:hypothetical protein